MSNKGISDITQLIYILKKLKIETGASNILQLEIVTLGKVDGNCLRKCAK